MADGDAHHHPLPRVLSIQSHVVHGYVGNRSATFPLQLLGFEVDVINSVQFSNHTGYPTFKGHVFDGAHLAAIMEGLSANGLLAGTTHLLTGYIGGLSLLEHVVGVVRALRDANGGQLTYVCDPVLGDEGRLYVAPEMVGAFRQHVVPLASVVVPNQTEAELLAGCGPIRSVEQGFAACDALHALGPHTVIITSAVLPEQAAAGTGAGDQPGSTTSGIAASAASSTHVTLLASTTQPQAGGPAAQRLVLTIPRINAYYTGTGDLVAALLLAWMHHHPGDLATAVEKATAGLQAVLRSTAAASGAAASAAQRTSAVCAARELRVIQNQRVLQQPVVELRCEAVGASIGLPPAPPPPPS
mmetsp:Transcript_37407/g.94391  ORF Transcript_37407/g.94391 Transcript_37407/m.94391 type:complete len:357 (-) Transcript_37407:212-1282(-)